MHNIDTDYLTREVSTMHTLKLQESKLDDLARKKKHGISATWHKKLNEIANSFHQTTFHDRTADIYQNWADSTLFLPKKFRGKRKPDQSEEQNEILNKLGFSKMKEEVIHLRSQAKKAAKRYEETRNYMTLIDRKATGSVVQKLKDIWAEDVLKKEIKMEEHWKKREEFL